MTIKETSMKKIIVLCAAALAIPAFAKIEMGAPFTDGVVLQRGCAVPVWGWATPNASVTVSFAGEKAVTTARADGGWRLSLPAMEASKEGRTMTATEATSGWFFDDVTDTVEVKDVLVGEVWFASGQSNMDFAIWNSHARYRDFAGGLVTEMTRLPCVRFVKTPKTWSVEPKRLSAKWMKMTPEAFRRGQQVSAVAYYYARELYLALDVPIGIVDSSWGGTNIDAWTPRCGYADCDPSIAGTAAYAVRKDWNAETDKKYPITAAHQQPTVLFNAMVDAFAPMAMKGFIWYQGCNNASESQFYCAKMHALYNGWSRKFENPGLKLYFVQLAPYSSSWTGIVAQQNKFVAEEPNAAIAVTADIGNFSDIHPNRKEAVAKRLAVHALKRDYGFDITEDDSPVFDSFSVEGDRMTVRFRHAKKLYLYSPDYKMTAPFELAGTNGVWKAATIENVRVMNPKNNWRPGDIEGDFLVLKAEGVAEPKAVRYMYQPHVMSTVYNEVSLPLGAFEAK